MTAEIGILNTRGLALAADSAVTIGGTKVRNNARKLFTLDSQHSIGIMIYGNADLMNVPWEILIAAFRKKLEGNVLNRISDYKESFFSFIENFVIFDKEKNSNLVINNYVFDLVQVLKNHIDLEKDMQIQQDSDVNTKNLQEIFFEALDKSYEHEEIDPFFNLEKTEFLKSLDKNLKNYLTSELGFQMSDEMVNVFQDRLYEFICSKNFSTHQTGVVIAGYGKNEYFPVLQQYAVDGFISGKLKYCLEQDSVIGLGEGEFTASLVPFAQQEMVHTVIFGIDPTLDEVRHHQLVELKKSLKESLPLNSTQSDDIDRLFKGNDEYFKSFQQKNYSRPIIGMLNALSLSELATMAQTMVSLTSFKRKFSGDVETVGGPIDVLVISKGEGPVWISRKKYFDKEMNEGYFIRRR